MKFWQLVSICRGHRQQLEEVLKKRRWSHFLDWYRTFDHLVKVQNRQILDFELPDELCFAVFSRCDDVSMYSDGDYLRPYPLGASDVPLSLSEAHQRYGGEKIEEAMEKGAATIDR